MFTILLMRPIEAEEPSTLTPIMVLHERSRIKYLAPLNDDQVAM